MTQAVWNVTKQNKLFYIASYRSAVKMLIISLFLNCLIILGVFYSYLNLPEPDYYATSGITPPIKLTGLDGANETSVFLLPEEVSTENEVKPIPE